MSQYILALDQGTTSSRSLVFDAAGRILGMAQQEFTQHYPQPGWVEHDPEEILSTQLATAREAVASAGLTMADIAAVGITNQRETTLVWDRSTGKAIHNAIVWQDRRTADFCDGLRRDGHTEDIRQRTGLEIDAYFSGTKVRWILDHVKGARDRAERGELAFGTVDSWLIWHLTGGEVHATDPSNASRTLLFNLHDLAWDPAMLDLLGVPAAMLPEVRPSSGDFGRASALSGETAPPIAGVAGDQQSALFGQQCTQPGMVKNTYGTGCFMLMNIGTQAVMSQHRLLTTVAWQIQGETQYALEGSVFMGGATVQWLRDELGIIGDSAEIEALAATVPDADGVVLVPAFAGFGTPHWNGHARGTLFGLTRGSGKAHIARAALDAIAHQSVDVLRAMEADAGVPIPEMRADGGATANDLLMQRQSDLLGIPVVRPEITETTALGAAYLAGLAVGYWSSTSDIQSQWTAERTFTPGLDTQGRQTADDQWQRAVRATLSWAENR
ncbi:MAG: glycerol kinase GlpK [Flavobacteriales bacterium]|nr:glycerol kinase GlpK [Flavobacteriales bacterium]